MAAMRFEVAAVAAMRSEVLAAVAAMRSEVVVVAAAMRSEVYAMRLVSHCV